VGNGLCSLIHVARISLVFQANSAGIVVTSMQQIAWVPSRSATITRLREIVPRHATVVAFGDAGDLVAAIADGRVTLTIVEAGGAHQELALQVLRRVHDAFPRHPLVAWCNLKTIATQELLDIARTGVQEIVRQDLDELRHAFTRIMALATQRAVSAGVAEALHDVTPVRLRDVVLYALERANEQIDRDAFAAVFGVSRRTIHARLIDAGLPPTREFLTWCRILVACALLDQPGRTLESVAGQLDLPGGGHVLRTTLRRYLGSGINRLRDEGVLESAMMAFRATIVAPEDRSFYRPPKPTSLPEPSSAD
jgi:AraC-like DNA-binding protein